MKCVGTESYYAHCNATVDSHFKVSQIGSCANFTMIVQEKETRNGLKPVNLVAFVALEVQLFRNFI